MAAPASDAPLPLCLTCGLCCDGTLFPHAPLEPDEIDHAAAVGMTLCGYFGRDGFSLPCPHLAGTVCTIYENRPSVCGSYSCGTLKALERGAIGRVEADRRVTLARLAERHARSALAAEYTLENARLRLRALTAARPEVARPIVALDRILDRYFREPAGGSLSGAES